jgi:hypothetical protein
VQSPQDISTKQRVLSYNFPLPLILVMTIYGLFLYSKNQVDAKSIYGTLLIQLLILLQKRRRNLLLIFLPLNLYACGPLIAFQALGINKYPFPSLDVLLKVAYMQVFSTYIVLFLSVLFQIDNKIRLLFQNINKESCLPGTSIFLPLTMLSIGLFNLILHLNLIINFANLQRHDIFESLNLVAGPFGIAFGQVASLGTLFLAVSNQKLGIRLICISGLILYWGPILLSGSRQYFLVFAISAVILLSALKIMSRSLKVVFISIVVVFILMVPAMFGYSGTLSYNEFIFPSQFMIQIFSKNLNPQGIQATSVLESWVLLLPGFLREDLQNSWINIIGMLTPLQIGVGGSPWIEWINPNYNLWIASSAFSIFLTIYFMLSISGVNVIAAVNLYCLTMVIGRTFFWNAIVISIGIFLIAKMANFFASNSGSIRKASIS